MHDFCVSVIGDSNAVMVCRKCGKSYILTDTFKWRGMTFQDPSGENETETDDTPARDCTINPSSWADTR